MARPWSTSAQARQAKAARVAAARNAFQLIHLGSLNLFRTPRRSCMRSGSPAALMSSLSGTVDAQRHRDDRGVQNECCRDPGQPRALVRAEVQSRGDGGEHQRAEEGGQEQRVDDRGVNRLERIVEGPIIRAAQAGHDHIGVEAEHTRDETHAHRGQDQNGCSQELDRTAWAAPSIEIDILPRPGEQGRSRRCAGCCAGRAHRFRRRRVIRRQLDGDRVAVVEPERLSYPATGRDRSAVRDTTDCRASSDARRLRPTDRRIRGR
jgi:hypothetical protein